MKNDRQLKILEIIGKEVVRTQEELTLSLRRAGFCTTQATVSRDVKELRLRKIADPKGVIRYAVEKSTQEKERETVDKYRLVLQQVLTSAVPAQNIGVIKTLSGSANAAAAALEAIGGHEIIGTLAGVDTLLVIFADNRAAFDFCREINTSYLKH